MNNQKDMIGQLNTNFAQNISQVFEKMKGAVVIFDHGYNYVFVNSEAATILRHSKEELIGNNLFKLFPDVRGSKVHHAYQQALATQTYQQIEAHYIQWDRWYLNKIIPSEDYLCIFIDEVADRKQTETALHESEARYRHLYEHAPDMFVSVDAKTTRIVQCNQTLTAALGYNKNEIIGQEIAFVYHPDCVDDRQKTFQEFVENGEVHNAELQLKRKDGSKIDVSLNVSSVKDEDGTILYSNSIWRDITKQKQMDERLKDSFEQSRVWLDNSPVCTKVVDLDFNLRYMSAAGIKALKVNDVTKLYGKPYPFEFFS